MRKLFVICVVMTCAPAWALTHFLKDQWIKDGVRFCKYSNDTVLNVGAKLCPLQIED